MWHHVGNRAHADPMSFMSHANQTGTPRKGQNMEISLGRVHFLIFLKKGKKTLPAPSCFVARLAPMPCSPSPLPVAPCPPRRSWQTSRWGSVEMMSWTESGAEGAGRMSSGTYMLGMEQRKQGKRHQGRLAEARELRRGWREMTPLTWATAAPKE
jgi:hypothetical protein